MKKVNAVKTTFRCKHCGGRLILMEKHGVLFFGCLRCDCYVIIPEWRLKEFKYGNLFNWKALMEYAYDTYIDVRESVCQ
jgi:DNA-directed RNA polymerase subunit RPC12/RpoP